LDDETVLAPSTLVPPAPAASPVGPPTRTTRGDGPTPFSAPGLPSAGGSFGDEPDAAFDQIEGRLAQVAGRLEQAAERLAASVGGARPRSFRGRIDG